MPLSRTRVLRPPQEVVAVLVKDSLKISSFSELLKSELSDRFENEIPRRLLAYVDVDK